MRHPTLAVGVLAVLPATASGQVPAGGSFRVNAYQTGYQFHSSAAMFDDGSFVVLWTSVPQDGSDNGIYAQLFTPSGTPAGAEFRVNTHTTASQAMPAVAALPGGGMVVVYSSYEDPRGIRARLYDRRLAPRGPEFRVQSAPAYAGRPQVAADPRGGFVVVWHGDDGDSSGALARRFDRSGAPIGLEFAANTVTAGLQAEPAVATGPAGDFLVVWTSADDGSGYGTNGQRFDGAGQRVGGEFRVNSYATGNQRMPWPAIDARGNATVAWASPHDGDRLGIFAQRYDATGAAVGGEFQVNAYTTGYQFGAAVRTDTSGNFLVVWGDSARGRRFDAQGVARDGEFAVTSYPWTTQVALGADRRGNFVVSWTETPAFDVFARRFGGLLPYRIEVDTSAGPTSDGNGILEPCEQVSVDTAWRNHTGAMQSFAGTSSSFTGPPGATYLLVDGTASYGTVADGAAGSCRAAGDCFAASVSCAPARLATHWDAVLEEAITPAAQGQVSSWPVHIGESFADVPRTSSFYRSVEAVIHQRVTAGCTAAEYCPRATTTRAQMAVFAVLGVEGPFYAPAACGITPMFADVPASSPYCRWIEELARRGVVGGCGGGNYCPGAPVTREELAVFVLRTTEPALEPPACTTPVFADVPATSPYCRWIEELARRGVVTGCGGGNYCPAEPVTREQMAVFIVFGFGLGLYTP